MSAAALRYRVDGMDCASCAEKVEAAARGVVGVEAARVSTTTQILELHPGPADPAEVERSVLAAGYRLEQMQIGARATPTHASPAYRRALVSVVALNLGYGILEMAGGLSRARRR